MKGPACGRDKGADAKYMPDNERGCGRRRPGFVTSRNRGHETGIRRGPYPSLKQSHLQ